mmetsp:Transcript_33403/g.62098  ORF Transcript_33403/g.62098 Transcript_33403/m.62098 type:complete len:168 (-) Transcript_33403:227-730(-)
MNQGATTLGNGRVLKNLGNILKSLKQKLSLPIVTINPGKEHYLLQFGLSRMAKVVVGMHGGGLWGSARWMTPYQAMIEILPIRGPGDTCMKAKMVGAKYRALVCSGCKGRDKSGIVDPDTVSLTVWSALSADATSPKIGVPPSSSTSLQPPSFEETRCSAIPQMTRG